MMQKIFLNKRRGVSNIIGSLIVLALVASVGSVILFQGLNQINAFNYDLTLHEKERVNELREDIIFEHVRFDPGALPDGDNLELYLANIGTVDTNILSVTVVKINTQELIFNRATPPTNQSYIPIEDHTKIIMDGAKLGAAPDDVWSGGLYGPGSSYKITVGTAKGNFFSTVVGPYNS